MAFKYYKTFIKTALADGAKYVDDWVADENLLLKRIHIKRLTGEELTDSEFSLEIAGVMYSRPTIVASVLGPDILVSPVLDIPFDKAQKLHFEFLNKEGVSIDVGVYFEVWAR